MPSAIPDIAVIAGSGFDSLLKEPVSVTIETPYGLPSADIAIGNVAGRRVALLARHGSANEHPPHLVNYRANIWALRKVGARRILSACTVSSLQPATRPGTFVVPDQLVDRTGRVQSFMDTGIVHAPFAEPFCSQFRSSILNEDVIDGGTLVVIDGPRFSTRAEAEWYAAQGWSMINMTGHPEAILARELGLCFASLALVANRDAGVASTAPADEPRPPQHADSIDRLKGLVAQAISAMPALEECPCRTWLGTVDLPFELP
ncbi:S-methyl-5'-thioadenosine phosphorylase [Nocardioides sp. WS12]|uniref:S-methyl-5'-thioadenosine phosphorylase n=1 Tax=Nocardioides sp. WS12 TaxID=2486272 RepID=UPI0015FC8E9D|nr:S-methyl-5'-thioadenosine phosphorylase [Nocardioides sp. WS12]